MDSALSLHTLKINDTNTIHYSQLHEIYLSKDSKILNNFIKTNPEFVKKHKFTLLLFTFLWEDFNTAKILFNQFENEFSKEIGIKNHLAFTKIYSKNLEKLYEVTVQNCLINNEYNLIKDILENKNFPIIFKENFFIRIIKTIPMESIIEISNIGIDYYPEYTLTFKERLTKTKLDKEELLKLLCKSNFTLLFLYNFIMKNYDAKNVISLLLKAKFNKIIHLIIKESNPKVSNYEKYFKIAAKYNNIKFIMEDFNILKKAKTFSTELSKMYNYLIYNFSQYMYFVDFRIYLITIHIQFFTYKQCKDILLKLSNHITSKEIDSNILFFVSNPIKTLLMIYELAYLIKKKFSSLQGLYLEIHCCISLCCKSILNSIKDYPGLYLILEDKAFSGESTCDLLHKYNLFELMKDAMPHLYIKKCWDNSFNQSINMFTISTPLKIIREDCNSNPIFQISNYNSFRGGYIRGSYLDFIRNPSTKFIYYMTFQIMIGILLFSLCLVMISCIDRVKNDASNFPPQDISKFN